VPVNPTELEPAPVEEVIDITPAGADISHSESGEEVVTVTGSRIAGSTVQQASHVTVVTAKDLQKLAVTTVDEALTRLPSVSMQGTNKQSNNAGQGVATVDLRNMGTGRTLVLINGRRMVNSGGEAVDLNTIPIAMVERIYVLLEGASVIYGSDAVAGVINIILKDDFEGIKLDTYGGISSKGDGGEIQGSLTMGTNYDRGNITVNVQGYARSPIWQKNRGWAAESVSSRDYNNGYSNAQGTTTVLGSTYIPEGRDPGYAGPDILFRPNSTTGLPYQPFSSQNKDDRFFFSKRQYLIGEQQRFQVTTTADYDITRHSRAFIEGMYTYRHSQTRLAAQPLSPNTTYADGLQIPITNPYLPAQYKSQFGAGTDFSDPSTTIGLLRRATDLGDRISDFDVNTSRAVVGLAGDVPKYELDWEVYANYGISRQTGTITNSVNMARVMESADPALCAANAAKGCVVGDYFGNNSLSAGTKKYIRYTDVSQTGFTQVSSGASVSAKPVELWAGKLGLAAGLLYRREGGFTQPSPVVIEGESGGNGQDPTKGHFSSFEFFGEAGVPLVAKVPGINHLDVDIAGRFSRYSSFGSKGTYRVSGVYEPIDSIKFRGTWSTAFRNPGVTDLYSGNQDSYETLNDPCTNWDTSTDATIRANCGKLGLAKGFQQTTSQVRSNVGGNKKLKAESANVWDLGVVLTPTFLPKKMGVFTANVDYYNVEVDHAISTPQPQFVLQSCYGSTNFSSPNCKTPTGQPAIVRTSNGQITVLYAREANIGKSHTAGMDIGSNYDIPLGFKGLHLILNWQGNRLFFYDDTINGEKTRYYKKILTNQGTYTQWRWYFTATVAGDHWSVSSFNRYIGGAKFYNGTWGQDPDDWVNSVTYWDASATYSIQNFSITGGINNILGTKPPFFKDGDTNSNGSTYDYTGRYFFARLSYKL